MAKWSQNMLCKALKTVFSLQKKVLEGQNPPMGTASSGVRSFTPWRHLTKGIGLPTATQVMLRLPPFFTCFGFHCFYFSTVSTATSSVIISVIAQIFINVITNNGKKSIFYCIIIIAIIIIIKIIAIIIIIIIIIASSLTSYLSSGFIVKWGGTRRTENSSQFNIYTISNPYRGLSSSWFCILASGSGA